MQDLPKPLKVFTRIRVTWLQFLIIYISTCWMDQVTYVINKITHRYTTSQVWTLTFFWGSTVHNGQNIRPRNTPLILWWTIRNPFIWSGVADLRDFFWRGTAVSILLWFLRWVYMLQETQIQRKGTVFWIIWILRSSGEVTFIYFKQKRDQKQSSQDLSVSTVHVLQI